MVVKFGIRPGNPSMLKANRKRKGSISSTKHNKKYIKVKKIINMKRYSDTLKNSSSQREN